MVVYTNIGLLIMAEQVVLWSVSSLQGGIEAIMY